MVGKRALINSITGFSTQRKKAADFAAHVSRRYFFTGEGRRLPLIGSVWVHSSDDLLPSSLGSDLRPFFKCPAVISTNQTSIFMLIYNSKEMLTLVTVIVN